MRGHGAGTITAPTKALSRGAQTQGTELCVRLREVPELDLATLLINKSAGQSRSLGASPPRPA